jgi:uroporphyrinogen III methyltransferase/synthase
MPRKTKVWLVGAGAGEPGLITVRGREVLRAAEVVLHDALSHPALLLECPNAEIRNVGKRAGERSPPQETINRQLVDLARQGKRVVRLKGGDSFLFARGAEEASALAEADIPFEIVPGVSSPVAASAYSGISFTHRDWSSSVTFITGSDRAGSRWSPDSWKKLATATDTICVLMGMRRIEEITQALVDGGRPADTPAAVIQWGARPEQRVAVATLGTIAAVSRQEELVNPAVIVVGQVVSLREKLAWYDNRPLSQKRVLVPRTAEQAKETARELRERGAEPFVFPVISLGAPPDPSLLASAAQNVRGYDWVLFTSANGVRHFFDALDATGQDTRALGSAKVGAIGSKTAEALESRAIMADVVSDEFVAEAFAEGLLARGALGRVLLPRALEAREVLPDTLRAHGASVDVIPAYQTRLANAEQAATLVEALQAGTIDAALFTSSSTVTNTVRLLGAQTAYLLGNVTVAAIGPVTQKTAEKLGIFVDVTASVYTVEGLLDALEDHFASAEVR